MCLSSAQPVWTSLSASIIFPVPRKTCIRKVSGSPLAAALTTSPIFWDGAGAPTTFVTPVGLQGVFGGFVEKQLQTLSFAQPVLLPDEANGCCYCLVEASGERTFMSIHGAEYSFNPAWMAPYAANHYAYGYVCGLEVEERRAACWWII